MINKKKIFSWILVCGIYFTFLVIFYNQFGIAQLAILLMFFLVCIALYQVFTKASTPVNIYAEDEDIRPNRKLKPNKIAFIKKICFAVLFSILNFIPLTFVFTVIHELGHATTALVFGIPVFRIAIISPRVGYTSLALNYNNSLVLIVGSLSEILSAIVLLVLIYRSKTVKLDGFISIFFSIWYNILESVRYWHDSIFIGLGDA